MTPDSDNTVNVNIIQVYSGEFGHIAINHPDASSRITATEILERREQNRTATTWHHSPVTEEQLEQAIRDAWASSTVPLWPDAVACEDPECVVCGGNGHAMESSSPLLGEDYENDSMGAESDPGAMGLGGEWFRTLRGDPPCPTPREPEV